MAAVHSAIIYSHTNAQSKNALFPNGTQINHIENPFLSRIKWITDKRKGKLQTDKISDRRMLNFQKKFLETNLKKFSGAEQEPSSM
jgi:hypothetical protein